MGSQAGKDKNGYMTRHKSLKTNGGESGIRTHVRVSPKHAFQACAFNHSAISPVAEKASARSLRAASNEAFISISCPRRGLEWSTVKSTVLSRRALLGAAASTAVGCGRKKATRIPGYCFVANQGSRSVAAVNLESFRVQRQISLDSAPAAVVAHPSKPKVFVLAPEIGRAS